MTDDVVEYHLAAVERTLRELIESGQPWQWDEHIGPPLTGNASDQDEKPTGPTADDEACSPLLRVRRAFGLDDHEARFLLTALAPELDPSIAELFATLQQPESFRRPTAALAAKLCGLPPGSVAARRLVAAAGPLVRQGLIASPPDTEAMTSPIVANPRIADFLLGSDTVSVELQSVLLPHAPITSQVAPLLAAGVAAGHGPVLVIDDPLGLSLNLAQAAFDALMMRSLAIDLQLCEREQRAACVSAAVLEAKLLGSALAVAIDPRDYPDTLRIRDFFGLPIVVCCLGPPPEQWLRGPGSVITAPPTTPAMYAQLWRSMCDQIDDGAAAQLGRAHKLNGAQVAAISRQIAEPFCRLSGNSPLEAATAAARSLSTGRVQLLTRSQPSACLADVVLTEGQRQQVAEITDRVRTRDEVAAWSVGGPGLSRRGVIALFTGPPGTGKTLLAEGLASELGMELYSVQLAQLVDKYVGETEKNLERVFSEAETVSGILLFDEADALFGGRTKAADGQARYSNLQVSYLLQRLESFSGISVLTSNRGSDMDAAFKRRIDVIIPFAKPTLVERHQIWTRCLGTAPLAGDVDVNALAELEMSGGEIHNVCLAAAHHAAARERALSMSDFDQAVRGEHRKLSRIPPDHLIHAPQ